MARRQKSGFLEDFTGLIAMLPWWAGIALAIITYLSFHALASNGLTTPTGDPKQLPSTLAHVAVHWLGFWLQFIVPALCVAGAGISAGRRAKRRNLASSANERDGTAAIASMSWQEFELLVGEAFRINGYDVLEKGGAQADGGIDLVLRKGNEKSLVQCKHWKARMVGVGVVRELYGVMAAQGAAAGFVVTSGRFTADALAFAKGRNVELIEGIALAKLLAAGASARRQKRIEPTADASAGVPRLAPACPTCGANMVKRVARKGPHPGSAFWGCSRYPACRGTVADS